MINQEEFLDEIKKNIKVCDEKLLIKVYNFAKEAHKEQKRDSGQPYFIHPLEIALAISEFKLDENSIIAGLLHDTVEDTNTTLKDIEKEFGVEVSYLVNGLTKIENAKFESKTEKNAENFRKLLISTAKDIRVLIIKLIDRLNNMRTISGISNKERRERIANETLIIYIPLAERIGMYKLKLELEDLCFKELFEKEREEIIKNIKIAKKNQKNIISDIVKKLNISLTFENNINCKITGREKRPYSIWKKMQKKSVSFEKLFDIIAFRIIVKNIPDCYKILGCINSNYVMVPDTFKDYISKSKSNGYQSLHIVIIGPKFIKMEIQIRTEEMQKIAEYGIASHWMYKQNLKKEENLEQYNFIRNLVKNLEESDYSIENFEDLKYEMHQDEIFCYTPKGDIINLPLGSTGIDFAYAIHRDIGNKCSGVKINGALSQFKTTLNSGDDVEITTSKNIQVNEEWLNFVKTTKAKNEIKSYLRNLRQKEFEEIGRIEIGHLSKKFELNVNDDLIQKNITKFNFGKTTGEVYSYLAQGKIKKKDFFRTLFPDFDKNNTNNITNDKDLAKIKINTATKALGIQGLDKNVAYKYARCCYPIPPDEIVGVVNSGTGITVHKKDCHVLKTIKDEQTISLEWNNNEDTKYLAKITITFESKAGLLAKFVNLCSEKKINIISINTINESEFYQDMELKIEIKNSEELENFKASVRSIKGVVDIK